MTRSILWLLAALAWLPGCAPNPAPEPVYRYINVLDGAKLFLGKPFVRKDLAEQLNDTTFRLRPGTFGGGGTTSIVARTDPAGILRSLTFVYDGSEPLADKVRNYTAHLGSPAIRREGKDESQLYVWQDDSTRFALHYDPKDTPSFWSYLSDRAGS